MSILDHKQQYETAKDPSHDQDFGKCFWFCGSMRLHKKKIDKGIVNDDIVQEQIVNQLQSEPDDQVGTYFKLNGSFADSDLSNSDEDQNQIQENGHAEDNNRFGMWFGLSGRKRRAESMANLLEGGGKQDEDLVFNDELENIDAQFKAIEQLVMDSFDQIDFGPSNSKSFDTGNKSHKEFEKNNASEIIIPHREERKEKVNSEEISNVIDVTETDYHLQNEQSQYDEVRKNVHDEEVSEESIVEEFVKDDYAMNMKFNEDDLEFVNTYLSGTTQPLKVEEEQPVVFEDTRNTHNKHSSSNKTEETPRMLLKRQMHISSSTVAAADDSNEDYHTSEDEENKNTHFKRGTSFRRSIVIEDEVGTTEKRKQSTGGTCVSVAFMAVNSSSQDDSAKKSTNQQLKGILNFLENMVIDEESLSLYYGAVRTLHTLYWDLKDSKDEDGSSKSLSSVLNFLVVHEWPKVMLSCFKKLKMCYPHVFMQEPDAESTIYYSGHLPSLLRINRTTSEFGVAVIFDGLLKAAVNFTDIHEASRQACCEDNLLSYLLQDIMPQLHHIKWGKATAREMFLKSICDLLYNCAQSYSNAAYLLEHNCVDILTAMRDQTFHVVDARKVNMAMLLSLSYLIDDNNYDMIVPSEDFVIRLLQFLDRSLEHSEHTYHDFYAAELVGCLTRLAGHSSVQIMITRNSGQEILHKLLKYAYDDEERIAACHALWNLAFCHEAKDILRGMSKLMNHLRELSCSSNSVLQRAASGVIWECEEKYDLHGTRETRSTITQHVMISYELEAQPLVIGMRDELNRQGYQVWMKVENDDRSLLESMTRGVELASVVIVAVTRKYKLTPYAFAEVDYAHKLRKTIVPVIVDVDFVPDGWLKDLIETQRTFDFSRRSMFGGSLDALVEYIKSLISPDFLQAQSLNAERPNTNNSDVLSWTNSDVIYWLQENQLIKSVSNAGRLNKLTGLHLLMFFDLKKESPDYYYSVLDSHLGFKDVLDTLEFTYAMDRLLGRERLI